MKQTDKADFTSRASPVIKMKKKRKKPLLI